MDTDHIGHVMQDSFLTISALTSERNYCEIYFSGVIQIYYEPVLSYFTSLNLFGDGINEEIYAANNSFNKQKTIILKQFRN